MRLPAFESIRNRIVAFALAATLIPAVTTAWISYVQNKRSLDAKIAEELSAAASQGAREIELWLKERIYDVRVFAASYEVSENLERILRAGPGQVQARARLAEYLRSVRARFVDYHELLVLDQLGRLVTTTVDSAGAIPFRDGWLDRVRAEDAILSDPYHLADGTAEIMLAVPILDPNQRFVGVFGARLTFQQLVTLLESFVPGDHGRVHLVDGPGLLVASAGSGVTVDTIVTLDPRARRRLAAGDSAIIEYEAHDGTPVVGTMVRLPRLDWSMLAEMPSAEAYAQIARLGVTTVWMVVALFVVVGLLAYLVGLSIVRPLNQLTYGATRVAAGDLDVDVPVEGGGELGYLTRVFNDMVARLRTGREELERLSVTDSLTGLFNRRRMLEILKDEVVRTRRHTHPLSLVMVDVDHFKRYNDTYGHPEGDEVLARVAALIRSNLRNGDQAARYGGEEFLLVLPETTPAGAQQAADRLRTSVANEKFGPDGVTVTLSAGTASFPTDGDSTEKLVAAADAALYRAKKGGRNRVVRARQDDEPVPPTPEPASVAAPATAQPGKKERRRKKKPT